MNDCFVLSFDQDWAPDYIVEPIVDQLINKGIKSTWFMTHMSPVLSKMKERRDLFEIGLHPNYMKGSDHGATYDEVYQYLINIIPEARVVRSHGTVQSGALMSFYSKNTQLQCDSTQFLPEMPNIRVLTHLTEYGEIKRIPIFWADDYELLLKKRRWSPDWMLNISGIKTLLFHPIHYYLNSCSLNTYRDLQKKQRDIKKVSPEIISSYVNNTEFGVKNLLDSIMNTDTLYKSSFSWMMDLV